MERIAVKSMVIGAQEQEHSFRTNRTATQYNINDYLPPSINSISRTSVFASRQKEKMYTEPIDKPNSLQLNEFKRKLERSEQEKQSMRREIERLGKKLEDSHKQMNEKDNTISMLTRKINDLQTSLKTMTEKCEQRPLLEHSRNNLHFIYFPKFSQKYEVSVQTDPTQYAMPLPTAFTKVPQAVKVDRQMSQIEEKMSKLNQFKKIAKEKAAKIHEYPNRFEKGDAIFSKIDDKENLMRLSNTFERLSNIPEERLREQSIEIMAVDSDQVERLIRMYME